MLRNTRSLSIAARYQTLSSFIYSRALYLLTPLRVVGAQDDSEIRQVEAQLLRKAMSLSTKILITEFAEALSLKSIAGVINSLASHLKPPINPGEEENHLSAGAETPPEQPRQAQIAELGSEGSHPMSGHQNPRPHRKLIHQLGNSRLRLINLTAHPWIVRGRPVRWTEHRQSIGPLHKCTPLLKAVHVP